MGSTHLLPVILRSKNTVSVMYIPLSPHESANQTHTIHRSRNRCPKHRARPFRVGTRKLFAKFSRWRHRDQSPIDRNIQCRPFFYSRKVRVTRLRAASSCSRDTLDKSDQVQDCGKYGPETACEAKKHDKRRCWGSRVVKESMVSFMVLLFLSFLLM